MQCWAGWALVTDLYALEACEKEQSKVRVQDESGRYSAKTVKFFFFFPLFIGARGKRLGKAEYMANWLPEVSTSRGRCGENPLP